MATEQTSGSVELEAALPAAASPAEMNGSEAKGSGALKPSKPGAAEEELTTVLTEETESPAEDPQEDRQVDTDTDSAPNPADDADEAEEVAEEPEKDSPEPLTRAMNADELETAGAANDSADTTVIPGPPKLARGERMANRYRLEDKLSENHTSCTWRAIDEKLRRAVGVHLLTGGTEHSRAVINAARAAALIGDPRFVQVLDAAEQDGTVYVVKEWLPDADNLTTLLASGPLPPYEVYELARSVSDAISVAHRQGQSHLRLDPYNVLRMHTGQYKIVGLGVEAALYGHDAEDTAEHDTRAMGALIYAALTRRWPGKAAFGLQEAPRTSGRLCSPGLIRPHMNPELEAIAMRALGHEVKHQPAFQTPDELAKAVAALAPILPPEPEPLVGAVPDYEDEYEATAKLTGDHYSRPSYAPPAPAYNGGGPRGPHQRTRPAPTPPPPLSGKFGGTVKVIVAVIVLAAVVLGTWAIAGQVKEKQPNPSPTGSADGNNSKAPVEAQKPPPVVPHVPLTATEITGSSMNAQDTEHLKDTFDGDKGSYWRTKYFIDGPEAKIRDGFGIVYDLGSEKDVRTMHVDLGAGGSNGGYTKMTLYAAPGATSAPTSQSGFKTVIGEAQSPTDTLDITGAAPVKSRYVLLWMTAMPKVNPGQIADYNVYNSGYQQAIREVKFTN